MVFDYRKPNIIGMGIIPFPNITSIKDPDLKYAIEHISSDQLNIDAIKFMRIM